MAIIGEGSSTTRPSSFLWIKLCFLEAKTDSLSTFSIHNKTWKAVVTGWENSTVTDGDRKVSAKLELSWTNAKDEASLGNSRALNAIFKDVD